MIIIRYSQITSESERTFSPVRFLIFFCNFAEVEGDIDMPECSMATRRYEVQVTRVVRVNTSVCHAFQRALLNMYLYPSVAHPQVSCEDYTDLALGILFYLEENLFTSGWIIYTFAYS